ncbi:fibroblast growth factor receptor-like 1 [Dermacentor variabilis]|uniref:fibroblast growth factor receptor-like 1 n=1 Tax=Dermacentor variabilis TaxID=34621 RepID=UPI003F5B1819
MALVFALLALGASLERAQCSVEPPKIQPFSFPASKAMPKKVVVHCVAIEGSEPFQFSWSRDGAQLPSGDSRVHVKQVSEAVSSLTISKAGAEDIGNYTCVATNAAGSDSATSQLLVTGTVPMPNQMRTRS